MEQFGVQHKKGVKLENKREEKGNRSRIGRMMQQSGILEQELEGVGMDEN